MTMQKHEQDRHDALTFVVNQLWARGIGPVKAAGVLFSLGQSFEAVYTVMDDSMPVEQQTWIDRTANIMDLEDTTPVKKSSRLKDLQTACAKTAVYPGLGGNVQGLSYVMLGLVGEVGEVAELVKKWIRGDDLPNNADTNLTKALGIVLDMEASDMGATRRARMMQELGDVFWYWCMCCNEMGFNTEDVVEGVLKKLKKRQEEGKLKGDGDER